MFTLCNYFVTTGRVYYIHGPNFKENTRTHGFANNKAAIKGGRKRVSPPSTTTTAAVVVVTCASVTTHSSKLCFAMLAATREGTTRKGSWHHSRKVQKH